MCTEETPLGIWGSPGTSGSGIANRLVVYRRAGCKGAWPIRPGIVEGMDKVEQDLIDRTPSQLYIGGRWRDASGGATLKVEDPSTGDVLGEVADATPEDAVSALDAAVEVQAEWAHHPPRERGEILRRAFELMNERAEELALLLTLEMGNRSRSRKPRSLTLPSSCAGFRRKRCASAA